MNKQELRDMWEEYDKNFRVEDGAHLIIRLLALSENDYEFLLGKFYEVSKRYIENPEFMLYEFRAEWRGQLGMSTIWALYNMTEYSDELVTALKRQSYAAPQVSARLALLGSERNIDDLSEWLQGVDESSCYRRTLISPKAVIAIRQISKEHKDSDSLIYELEQKSDEEYFKETLKDYRLIKKFMVERNLYRAPDREESI